LKLMIMKSALALLVLFAALPLPPAQAKPSASGETEIKNFRAPKDAVILIIRHAEKPEKGFELSPAGQQRAHACVSYFQSFAVDATPLKLDAIYATADSKQSHRPRLTVEPLARTLNLTIRNQFKDAEVAQLGADISGKHHEKNILICWHHGEIPALLGSLGADPAKLLPGGKWPATEFGWVIQLRYDHEGRLIPGECRRIEENLKLAGVP
jgi:hypothetical protein